MEPEYKIFKNTRINELVYESLSGADRLISKLMYELYNEKIRCTSTKEWYIYEAGLWRRDDSAISQLISTDLIKYYEKVSKYYERLKPNNDNKKRINTVSKLTTKLKTQPFQRRLIRSAYYVFHYNNIGFQEQLDNNTYLIGFKNGVYDLEKAKFRNMRPDDYISITMSYDYKKKPTKHAKSMMKFLEDIMPDEDSRDYLLKFISCGLYGTNNSEMMAFWVGTKSKNILNDLVMATLGEYAHMFDGNLISGRVPSSRGCKHELMKFRNKRFVVGTNLNKNVNGYFLRYMAKNESIFYTQHKQYQNFTPSYTICALCDEMPKINNMSESVRNHTVCIEFPVDITKEYDIMEWRQDFMRLLIEKYHEENKYNIPKNIAKFTKLQLNKSMK